MTGPEHYAEAERLLEVGIERRASASYIAEAQVHATLALAAASALRQAQDEWVKVAG